VKKPVFPAAFDCTLDFLAPKLDIDTKSKQFDIAETVMIDDTNKHGAEANAAEAAASYAEAAAEQVDAPVSEPDPLELAKAEAADMRDRYLRLAAEMDNLRRRTARDVKDAKSYSVAGFARDMLAVSDNLRRALDAIPAEAREAGDAGFNALIEGVEMTERAMLSALERHGVQKLEPVGQKFDPNFHQAMFEVPNAEVPNNTVVQVVQAGYTIGERVLRPAMVGVAKGGPKVVATEETPAA
jgi:molecular chaperone GrpE